jgi:acyl carrier protein
VTQRISLRTVMQEIFECGITEIDENAKVNHISGWDSLNHINLILKLNSMGVEIATSIIQDLTTYTAIRNHIEKQGIAVES